MNHLTRQAKSDLATNLADVAQVRVGLENQLAVLKQVQTNLLKKQEIAISVQQYLQELYTAVNCIEKSSY